MEMVEEITFRIANEQEFCTVRRSDLVRHGRDHDHVAIVIEG